MFAALQTKLAEQRGQVIAETVNMAACFRSLLFLSVSFLKAGI
jgi:hypothetical protein